MLAYLGLIVQLDGSNSQINQIKQLDFVLLIIYVANQTIESVSIESITTSTAVLHKFGSIKQDERREISDRPESFTCE